MKSGKEIRMKCENIETTISKLTGKLTSWDATGVTENKPISMDLDNVDCVYRVLSDESEE